MKGLWEGRSFRVFIFCFLVKSCFCQTFVRSCNDPYIVDHIMRWSHTYCDHACGFPSFGTSSCGPLGNCICPCDFNGAQVSFGDFCPPDSMDMPDPNPLAEFECTETCNLMCPGAQSQICGEIRSTGMDDAPFAKICTCICPPNSCPLSLSSSLTALVSRFPWLNELIIAKKIQLLFTPLILKALFIKLIPVFKVVGFLTFLIIKWKILKLILTSILYSSVMSGYVNRDAISYLLSLQLDSDENHEMSSYGSNSHPKTFASNVTTFCSK